MKSLCCLLKYEQNSQILLLFIVYIHFQGFFLGFSHSVLVNLDTIIHEENNEMYSQNYLNSLDLLSSELFIIINLNLFKSLIQTI